MTRPVRELEHTLRDRFLDRSVEQRRLSKLLRELLRRELDPEWVGRLIVGIGNRRLDYPEGVTTGRVRDPADERDHRASVEGCKRRFPPPGVTESGKERVMSVPDRFRLPCLVGGVPDLPQRLDGRGGDAGKPLHRMSPLVEAAPARRDVLQFLLQHVRKGPGREEFSLVLDPDQIHPVTPPTRL